MEAIRGATDNIKQTADDAVQAESQSADDAAQAEVRDAGDGSQVETKGLHRRLVREVTERRRLASLGMLGAVGAVLIAVGAYLMTHIVGAVFLSVEGAWSVGEMTGLLLAVWAVRALVVTAEGALVGRLAADMAARFRRLIVDALGAQQDGLARAEVGELVASLMRGAQDVSSYYAQFLPQAVRTAVIVPILVALVFALDVSSAAILCVTIPLLPFFMMLIGLLAKKKAHRQWHELSRLGAHLYDVLAGLGTLRYFSRSREQAQVVARMSRSFGTQTLAVLKVAFLSSFALELIATLSVAMVAVAIGLRLVFGDIAFVDAFWILLLVPEVYLPLRRLGAQFHTAMVSLPAAARLYELIDRAARLGTGSAAQGARVRRCQGAPEIALRDVVYTYDGGERALCGATLTVRAGAVTALVGRSGSGKTTLLKVVAGLLTADAGCVTVDGTCICDWDERAYGDEIAYALQNVHLFRRSVADNIALQGRSRAQIEEAARLAGADAFIRAIGGYDTMLGDGGHILSGGEARRLALARAFGHGGSIFLLDEWTEGLDAVTQARLWQAVDMLKRGRTTLMVAHRLQTAMRADYIAVMDGGRIVEYGTPEDLTARGGIFANMVNGGAKEGRI